MSQPELRQVTPPSFVEDVTNENPDEEDDVVVEVDTSKITASSPPPEPVTESEAESSSPPTPTSDKPAVTPEAKAPGPSLFTGDIVVKKMAPKQWDYVPSFGTVLKQPMFGNVAANQPKTFNIRWESNNT